MTCRRSMGRPNQTRASSLPMKPPLLSQEKNAVKLLVVIYDGRSTYSQRLPGMNPWGIKNWHYNPVGPEAEKARNDGVQIWAAANGAANGPIINFDELGLIVGDTGEVLQMDEYERLTTFLESITKECDGGNTTATNSNNDNNTT